MHSIEMQEMTPDFGNLWQAAGRHLNAQVQDGIQTWMRVETTPPFLEHLSFRLGNQLFFIRVEDVKRRVIGPGTLGGLHMVADGNRGHACILEMQQEPNGKWIATGEGWGLKDALTGAPVDPLELVSDEKIEMTDWELQDMAVQVVRDTLKEQGYQLMSWQSNPDVDPAIWFVGESSAPEWVVVRAVRYPEKQARQPDNWEAIAAQCARLSTTGHFASVALVSADQPFESDDEDTVPLWRGYGMYVRFMGLE